MLRSNLLFFKLMRTAPPNKRLHCWWVFTTEKGPVKYELLSGFVSHFLGVKDKIGKWLACRVSIEPLGQKKHILATDDIGGTLETVMLSGDEQSGRLCLLYTLPGLVGQIFTWFSPWWFKCDHTGNQDCHTVFEIQEVLIDVTAKLDQLVEDERHAAYPGSDGWPRNDPKNSAEVGSAGQPPVA